MGLKPPGVTGGEGSSCLSSESESDVLQETKGFQLLPSSTPSLKPVCLTVSLSALFSLIDDARGGERGGSC